MENVTPVLISCNGLSDIHVCGHPGGDTLLVMLGTAVVEVVQRLPTAFYYKACIGRLANLGVPVRELERLFKHDHRSITNWAKALKLSDHEAMLRAFAGRGAAAKMTDFAWHLVGALYQLWHRTERDYTKKIQAELLTAFKIKVCGETLRPYFRKCDKAFASVAAETFQAKLPVVVGVSVAEPLASAPDGCAPPVPPPDPLPVDCPNPVPPPIPQELLVARRNPLLLPRHAESVRVAEALPVLPGFESLIPTVLAPPLPPVQTTPEPSCAAEAPPPPGGANGCVSVTVSSSEPRRLPNPSPAPPGLPFSGYHPPSGVTFCHHAGMILLADRMDMADCGRLPEWGIHRQWLGQVLQGAVNIERSKCVHGPDLARFTGVRSCTDDTQRLCLSDQARDPIVVEWLLRSNARLVPDGPGRGRVFYLDPHTKEYTGDLKILLGWCGRIHDTAKVLHMDFIHSESGWPVWMRHWDNYLDLRVRVFDDLEQFELLFEPALRKWITYVIDRGIFGLDTILEFMERHAHLITWEKGYNAEHSAWDPAAPVERFTLERLRNHSKDKRVVSFEVQEAPWPRHTKIRRLIVRATSPEGRLFEVAVLCTNPDLTVARIVRLIFSRWLQENNFKMLDRHFGFMELTSRRSTLYAKLVDKLEDQTVDSPEYRDLKKQFREKDRLLETNLLARENISDALDAARIRDADEAKKIDTRLMRYEELIARLKAGNLPDDVRHKLTTDLMNKREELEDLTQVKVKTERTVKKLEARQVDVRARVVALKQERENLRETLDKVERDDSRLRLLCDGGYSRLDTQAKAVMDAVRLTAHSIYANLLADFRLHYDNRRDDAVILRLLMHAPGQLQWRGHQIVVTLLPRADLAPAVERAVDRFLAVTSQRINEHFGARAAPVLIVRDGSG